MSGYAKNKLLLIREELPDALRTLGRAQILLILDHIEPSTTRHIMTFDFPKSSIRKQLRDFVRSDLIHEHMHLYRLTARGKQMKEILLTDPLVFTWYENNFKSRINQSTRPSIEVRES